MRRFQCKYGVKFIVYLKVNIENIPVIAYWYIQKVCDGVL